MSTPLCPPPERATAASRAPARLFLVALALAAAAGCAGVAGPAAPTPAPTAGALALRAGDGLRLYFPREPELNGEYPVDETGSVVLPLLGRRQVTGIPADTLKATLIHEFEAQVVNQSVQVVPLTRVRILGAVNRPGLYAIDATMTLGDAVALAGGATPTGHLEDVRVVRDGAPAPARLASGAVLWGRVRSGDQVVVPERSWFARNGAVVVGASISALGLLLSQAVF